jgi:RNA polymerase sigma-70 factor (ECF subfamily)
MPPFEIQKHLGEQLRAAYGPVAAAELPPRLTDLITRLENALAPTAAPLAPEFRDAMLEALPNLRAFAISLTGNPDRADDCVQNAILKALKNKERFEPGTNLPAWLFTILRNSLYSEYRKRRHEVQDTNGTYAAELVTAPDQAAKLDLQDVQAALMQLHTDQREAILLIAAEGLSYEEAGEILGVPTGTVKSRVNRARQRLAKLMGIKAADDLGSDGVTMSALHSRS